MNEKKETTAVAILCLYCHIDITEANRTYLVEEKAYLCLQCTIRRFGG